METKIIDILSDTSFDGEHIPNAINCSIYETAFPKKIKEFVPDTSTHIVVYGYSDETQEAQHAVEKLKELGYTNVEHLEGGLKAWKAAGNPTEGTKKSGVTDGTYNLDLEKSKLHWASRNIGSMHNGSVRIQTGSFTVENGTITDGQAVFDMTQITNYDVDDKYKQMLIDHLKSGDFFLVEQFPKAHIDFVSMEKVEGPQSEPNVKITADLTIKDKTNQITFSAYLREKADLLHLNAHFDIDRTRWDIKYGSEKFFAKLGMHIIDDHFSFDILLVAKKS